MRLTKIYTKVGDKGSTRLATGERILKSDWQIEAYGTVDELNAFIGYLSDLVRTSAEGHVFDNLLSEIGQIQNELFDIGGELSFGPSFDVLKLPSALKSESVTRLEKQIDRYNEKLPPLENFVLPGGHLCNSAAHMARTVCRRAERSLVRYQQHGGVIRSDLQVYLNRLSDWLFVVSRYVSHSLSIPERTWQQRHQ